jgi:hypothetical protein
MRPLPPRHPSSEPYRAPPRLEQPLAKHGRSGGDVAVLVAVVVVGSLPFVGHLLGRVIAGWELGLGTTFVLAATWALLDDLVDRERPGRGEVASPRR